MKKTIVAIVILALFAVSSLAALEGEVVTVSGKVEYQGSGGSWMPLKSGDTVNSGTMISTGFKSNATIRLGASILSVKPLTRMTLTTLSEKEDVVDTEVYLDVGTVKAEVKSYNNKRNGFSVRSPVATASVRGTVFEMGDKVTVFEGSVEVATSFGQTRTGNAGQNMDVTGDTLSNQITEKKKEMNPISVSSLPSTESASPIQPIATGPGAGGAAVIPESPTSVTITIQ